MERGYLTNSNQSNTTTLEQHQITGYTAALNVREGRDIREFLADGSTAGYPLQATWSLFIFHLRAVSDLEKSISELLRLWRIIESLPVERTLL